VAFFFGPTQMLRPADFHSGEWKRLAQELQVRLQSLRELNDGKHDPVKTAEIRGQISEVKRMLALRDERSAGSEAHPGEDQREHTAD